MSGEDNHITYKFGLAALKISKLMSKYADNNDFIQRAAQLRGSYPGLMQFQWGEIESLVGHELPQQYLNQEWADLNPAQLARYHGQVVKMANDFGLRCHWGPEAIWMYLRHPTARTPMLGFQEPMPISWNLEIYCYPDTKLKDLQKQASEKLMRDWPDISRILEKMPGFIQRRRLPQELDKHITWLYKRIALKKTAKQIFTEELDAEDLEGKQECTMETIQEAIKSLASELGIKLPRGRPTKKQRI